MKDRQTLYKSYLTINDIHYLQSVDNYLEMTKIEIKEINKMITISKSLWVSGLRQNEFNKFLKILNKYKDVIDNDSNILQKKVILSMMSEKLELKSDDKHIPMVSWYSYYQLFARYDLIKPLCDIPHYNKDYSTKIMKHFKLLLNKPDVTTHSFRRGSALHLYINKKVDVLIIMRFLNHKNVATTQLYLDELEINHYAQSVLEKIDMLC